MTPLPRDSIAPRLARQLIAERLRPELDNEQVDTARLLVSELVTNAVIHGRGEITLKVDVDAARLWVDVTDEGNGFGYKVQEVGFEVISGRGLWLVGRRVEPLGRSRGHHPRLV